MKPNIVIYHEDLLAYSETFILSQAESVQRFTPHYVGTRRVTGIETPRERTMVLNDHSPLGRARELTYKATGFSPHLVSHLRALNPVLMHAHFGSDGAMALPLAQRLRLPLVVTFHGYDATTHDDHLRASRSLRNRRLLSRRPQLIASCALIIAVSDHIRRSLLARGYRPEQVVTHYTGIDPTHFTPDPDEVREAAPTVLFVGRFVEKKGCVYLLRAMQAVTQAVPGARLVLIGDGPLRAEMEAAARDLHVHAEFLGRQSIGSVRDWMRRAWVFCLPSITASSGDTEGLPTVILEAMASGLPTVTTDSAGNPEAVTDGEVGFTVPERDEAGLAQALVRLLRDEPLRRRFARLGRQVVLDRFDMNKQARALEALYERASATGEAPRRTPTRVFTPDTEGVGGT